MKNKMNEIHRPKYSRSPKEGKSLVSYKVGRSVLCVKLKDPLDQLMS